MTLNETIVMVGQGMADIGVEAVRNGTPWWVVLLAFIGAGAVIAAVFNKLNQGFILLLYPLALIKLGYDYWKKRRKSQ